MKYEITAKRIREAMSDMGMTQQELADKSKIGKSSISHYVNGTNEPGNKYAYALAEALKVNPAWLMGLDVPKHLSNTVETIVDKDYGTNSSEYIEKALSFLKRYEDANPEVQAAIRTLLKFPQ